MTMHRLELFIAIARCLNVSKVARQLHISQPSISLQMKLLQEEYGVVLFTREGRGLKLTEIGQAFWLKAETVLQKFDELRRSFSSVQSRDSDKVLRVGGSFGASASFLPSLMTTFNRNHPSVELQLRSGTSRQIRDLLFDSQIEIAVITNLAPSPMLHMEPCRKEIAVAFVSADHPLAKKQSLQLIELGQTPLIIRGAKGSPSRSEELLTRLKAMGITPRILMRCDSGDSIKAAVARGEGIGILYKDVVEPGSTEGTLKYYTLTA